MLESMFSAIQSVGTAASTDVDTMESRSQEFCNKLAAIGVNTAELKEIFECNGNSLIVSGAGSGKTTALVLKILHDLYCGYCYKTVEIPSVTGDNYVKVTANILVTTFLKSGAEDLKRSFFEWAERLNIRGFDSSKIVFKTLHAEVYQALVAMTGIKPEIVADGQKYIRAVMKKYGIRSVLSRSRTVTLEEIRDIECILSYARNRLDDEKYSHPLMSDYKLDSTVLEAIIKDTKLQRQLEQVSDYEDMQELLLDALKKYPNVRSNIASRYDYIYCDEFQDTSQLQYAILEYYIDGAKRITAIGDDDQCIYSWRGSDINIITKFFIADFEPCVFRLMTNYRCKSNILNAVVPSITKNVNRVEKSLKAYKDGGTVDVLLNYPVSHLIDAVKK
ncbi:MAG: UvrD-helicase domain-containing protein, partial [Alphaproteobacteria bacterium]|nr:UvrD-helicase domain-containing protein [Alphaproteobacteria bacterium]